MSAAACTDSEQSSKGAASDSRITAELAKYTPDTVRQAAASSEDNKETGSADVKETEAGDEGNASSENAAADLSDEMISDVYGRSASEDAGDSDTLSDNTSERSSDRSKASSDDAEEAAEEDETADKAGKSEKASEDKSDKSDNSASTSRTSRSKKENEKAKEELENKKDGKDSANTGSDSDSESGSEVETEKKTSVLDSLPSVGDEIHGFKVTDITDFDQKNAKVVSMTHEKSGAELIYVACDDSDKAFAVYYKTAALSDQGIPHIFEHVTLAGSDKYPNADIFFDLSGNTYNTYMNAATWQENTGYIMASLSDKQLLKLADFYMAGLTDPLALKEENTLSREAYRFSMASLDDDISVTGSVFNEMESANADQASFAFRKALKLLYPESRMSYNSGGYRDDIITVTLDELNAYHAKYYHPSNMLITMYGDMDYEQYLKLLDEEYLSDYDKKDVNVSDAKYIPWTGEKTAAVDYPVTEDASVEDSSTIMYSISLGSLSAYDSGLMSVIADLLGAESSPIAENVKEAFPGATLSVYTYDYIDQPVMFFQLDGVNEGDGEEFKKIISDGIGDIVENGLDEELVDAAVNYFTVDDALSQEEPGGISTLNGFGCSWAVFGDKLSYLDKLEVYDKLAEEAKAGTLDDMIEDYLYEPLQSVVAEVVPKAGLREELDGEFDEYLADKKASMTKLEQAELVGATAMYDAWVETQADTSEYIDELNVLSRDDLEETVQEAPEIEDETSDDGIRTLTGEIEDAVYLSSNIYLNADTLDFDEIHDMVFLGELLGTLGTEKYSEDELYNATLNCMYSIGYDLSVVYDDDSQEAKPYFKISFINGADRISDAFDLIGETLKNTDFSDAERIRSIAQSTALSIKNDGMAYNFALEAAKAAADEEHIYEYYARYTEYLNYLEKVGKMSDKQIKNLGSELEAVLTKLMNTNGMIFTAAGSAETLESAKAAFAELTKDFETEKLPAVDYSEDLKDVELSKSIGVTINDSVNFNGFAADNDDIGLENNGKNQVCMTTVYNKLLFPEFRYNIGAYGFMYGIGDQISCVVSYRDPEIEKSFEALKAAPKEIEELDVTDADVEGALLSVYSTYAYPKSRLSLTEKEMEYIIKDSSESYAEETLANMRSAKDTDVDDVKGMADVFEALTNDGVLFTAGNSDSIKKNSDLYELTIEELTK